MNTKIIPMNQSTIELKQEKIKKQKFVSLVWVDIDNKYYLCFIKKRAETKLMLPNGSNDWSLSFAKDDVITETIKQTRINIHRGQISKCGYLFSEDIPINSYGTEYYLESNLKKATRIYQTNRLTLTMDQYKGLSYSDENIEKIVMIDFNSFMATQSEYQIDDPIDDHHLYIATWFVHNKMNCHERIQNPHKLKII
ncbi:MAG: hypothetical protein O7C56_06155 [Rickettsia endosymbiont of Ixodes persulcatus]|nr:hypothetical protein [Rickettsia endosymbiont of Ixodes persulcatus]